MKSTGFTLVEVLVVVAIAGILTAVALPNFRSFILKTRLKTAVSDMHTSLTLARSEAVKRNATITVVPASASDWSQGWSVKFGSQVVSKQDAYTAVTFTPTNAAYGSKSVTSISFQGTGREGSSDGIAFILSIAGQPTIDARCVVLDPSGRPTVRVDHNRNASDGCN